MKTPVLTVLGVAGACAACCAIPVAIPVLSGASLAGVVTLVDWKFMNVDREALAVGASIGAALLVGAVMWLVRGRGGKSCAARPAVQANSCTTDPGAGGCGCPTSAKPALVNGAQK